VLGAGATVQTVSEKQSVQSPHGVLRFAITHDSKVSRSLAPVLPIPNTYELRAYVRCLLNDYHRYLRNAEASGQATLQPGGRSTGSYAQRPSPGHPSSGGGATPGEDNGTPGPDPSLSSHVRLLRIPADQYKKVEGRNGQGAKAEGSQGVAAAGAGGSGDSGQGGGDEVPMDLVGGSTGSNAGGGGDRQGTADGTPPPHLYLMALEGELLLINGSPT
jgi:hypothetical protein